MDIFEVMEKFPDEESCVLFLEEKRWKDGVCCIHCGSEHVSRRNKSDLTNGWDGVSQNQNFTSQMDACHLNNLRC